MEPLENKELLFNLPTLDSKLWEKIVEKLSEPIEDIESLILVINSFSEYNRPKMTLFKSFDSLKLAINDLKNQFPDFEFYQNILPDLQKTALQMPELFKKNNQKLNLLRQGENSELQFSSQQIKCLLCHGFFNTLTSVIIQNPKNMKTSFGDISFYRLFGSLHNESVERIKCQLFYFYQTIKNEKKDEVTFIRRVLGKEKTPDWLNDKTPIDRDVFISSIKRIEESDAYLHANFANKNLMIHQIIPSMTQEEILFSLRPALFVCMLVSETMASDEAIFMLGCRRYSDYKGYLDTFKFLGPYSEYNNDYMMNGIISIDSVVNFNNSQFQIKFIDRDLNKAYLGFTGLDNIFKYKTNSNGSALDFNKISTGNWGCGAFGGDFQLKFIQQIMAAHIAKKNLDYSTFGDEEKCKKLRVLYEKIKEQKWTVKDLYEFLTKYKGGEYFGTYVKNKIISEM